MAPLTAPSVLAYIEQILVPTLHPGDLVITNNLNVHKVAGVRVAIASTRATLLLSPCAASASNEIEVCFVRLDAIVCAARCRSIETLWPSLDDCLQLFSPDECQNDFRNCDYTGARRLWNLLSTRFMHQRSGPTAPHAKVTFTRVKAPAVASHARRSSLHWALVRPSCTP